MARMASKSKKRPGLTRRMTRSTLRAGMLATAVMVGRKTAGGARTSDGQATGAGGSDGSQGLGAAAGDVKNYAVRTWSLRRSAAYGSKHYDEKPAVVTGAKPCAFSAWS